MCWVVGGREYDVHTLLYAWIIVRVRAFKFCLGSGDGLHLQSARGALTCAAGNGGFVRKLFYEMGGYGKAIVKAFDGTTDGQAQSVFTSLPKNTAV